MMQEIESIVINIKKGSSIPKFIQVVESIIKDIQDGKIIPGQRIPSINELSKKNTMSRDTIEKAYKILSKQNIIFSVKGIGYFVSDHKLKEKLKVIFFINKPSSYKLEVLDSFVNTIGSEADVSMYLYYCDENLFAEAVKNNLSLFDYFVIMPHFRNKNKKYLRYTPKVLKAIESIPEEKLIITDNSCAEIPGARAAVFQDFSADIIQALEQAMTKLKKYEKIVLVYPLKSVYPYPSDILIGFREFCGQYNFNYEIVNEIFEDIEFETKEVYITIQETDLVKLVKQIKAKNLIMGKDVGVISYNETVLKDLLGITVFSSDFRAMGESAARMLLTGEKKIFKNPFKYIERQSL